MPWYKRFEFWTSVVAVVVELVIGFGWPEQAALLASVAGLAIAALVAGGIVTRETIKAQTAERLATYQRTGAWPGK